jgi:hypothetical protein
MFMRIIISYLVYRFECRVVFIIKQAHSKSQIYF